MSKRVAAARCAEEPTGLAAARFEAARSGEVLREGDLPGRTTRVSLQPEPRA